MSKKRKIIARRKVKIQSNGTPGGTKVLVDGREIDACAIDFHIDVNNVGKLKIETPMGELEFEGILERIAGEGEGC